MIFPNIKLQTPRMNDIQYAGPIDFPKVIGVAFACLSVMAFSSLTMAIIRNWGNFNEFCDQSMYELTGRSVEDLVNDLEVPLIAEQPLEEPLEEPVDEDTEKLEEECSTVEKEPEQERSKNEPIFTTVRNPLVKNALYSMKEGYTFGIERYRGGPFIELNFLLLQDGFLLCNFEGKIQSVQKVIEQVKATTRPRWIKHLCFIKDGKPTLFKNYLRETENLMFS